jgi:hypothetical protein
MSELYTQLTTEQAERGQEKLQALLVRSTTDLEFRKKLLTEPRAALAEFSGHDIPESVNIKFIESKGRPTIVLPNAIDPAAELSSAELEAVAGGTSPLASILSIIASVLDIINALER